MSLLREVHAAVRGFPGVTRKNAISGVTGMFPTAGFPHIYAAEGEDAAAIDFGDDYLLFAADGIMESLIRASPYYAGYFAVLVNVNDIAAMGGRPLGMTDVLSVHDPAVRDAILKGMKEGVRQFGVPLVGGHTHPDARYDALDVSVTGRVPKDAVLLSSTATPGDDIVFVSDLVGKFPDEIPFAFISTEGKPDETVRLQLEIVAEIAEAHLAHSCKDISNPGNLGTLGMMLECSGVGATVDITRIPAPDGVELSRWVLAYQGSGFVFACPPSNSERIIGMFSEAGCTGAVVGKVEEGDEYRITDGQETMVLFDFSKEAITGIRPVRR